METHSHVQHGARTISVFLSGDGKASWLLLPIFVSLLSGSTVETENTDLFILKVTGLV